MTASHESLVAIAREHSAAEGVGDLETVLGTLEDDPVYELQPVGLEFRGMDAVRAYYDYFFSTFSTFVAGATLRGESVAADGVVEEYTIWTKAGPGNALERHEVVGILTFGDDRLSGERVYGSERLLRLMFGPVYDISTPIAVGEPT